MSKIQILPTKEHHLKSYIFKVVLEQDKWPDEPDSEAVWRAYIPVLESKGVASWGDTKEEALENLETAFDLVVAAMIEDGEQLPVEPTSQVEISEQPVLSITA